MLNFRQQFKALGDTNIVLSSARAVKEVLDKHGAITGARPQVVLQNAAIRDVLIAHLDVGKSYTTCRVHARIVNLSHRNRSLETWQQSPSLLLHSGGRGQPSTYATIRMHKTLLRPPRHA
jgi:hypothetical protein